MIEYNDGETPFMPTSSFGREVHVGMMLNGCEPWGPDDPRHAKLIGWIEDLDACSRLSKSPKARGDAVRKLGAFFELARKVGSVESKKVLSDHVAANPVAFGVDDGMLAHGYRVVGEPKPGATLVEILGSRAYRAIVAPLLVGRETEFGGVVRKGGSLHAVLVDGAACAVFWTECGRSPTLGEELEVLYGRGDDEAREEALSFGSLVQEISTAAVAAGPMQAEARASLAASFDMLDLDGNAFAYMTGSVRDVRGVRHPTSSLPEGLVVEGDLVVALDELPATFRVPGKLSLRNEKLVGIRDGMRVGILELHKCKKVVFETSTPPIDTVVVSEAGSVAFQGGVLVLGQGLDLIDCMPVHLPPVVVGAVNALDTVVTGIRRVKGDVFIEGRRKNRILDGARIFGDLDFENAVSIGAGVVVSGDADIVGSETDDVEIGDGMRIGGHLAIESGQRIRIRKDVRIGHHLEASARVVKIGDRLVAGAVSVDCSTANIGEGGVSLRGVSCHPETIHSFRKIASAEGVKPLEELDPDDEETEAFTSSWRIVERGVESGSSPEPVSESRSIPLLGGGAPIPRRRR